MTIPPKNSLAKIDEAISHYPVSKRSASLPLLHLWQEHFGWISTKQSRGSPQKLELQPINILELVTFYPMFRRSRQGRNTSASAEHCPAQWPAATNCAMRLPKQPA